jgi:hypothetical protein
METQQRSRQSSLLDQMLLKDQVRFDLSGLSFTSRIAFYALYEAWRLLQELTGRRTLYSIGHHNTQTGISLHSPPPPPPPSDEDAMLEEDATAIAVPDVIVGSTQQNDRNQEQMISYCDDGHRQLESESAQFHEQVSISASLRSYSASAVADYFLPDIVPHMDQELAAVAAAEDITNCHHDYSGMLSKKKIIDGSQKDPSLKSNWCAAGMQLSKIAASAACQLAFINIPEDPGQRELFKVYNKIKIQSLKRDCRSGSGGELGLVKSVCRQIILSGIWILLKKVL